MLSLLIKKNLKKFNIIKKEIYLSIKRSQIFGLISDIKK